MPILAEMDDCAGYPCQNGGTCADGIGSYICTCPAGYSDKQCSTNINECASSPCTRGGTCTDGLASFTCLCASGYTGITCLNSVTSTSVCLRRVSFVPLNFGLFIALFAVSAVGYLF